MVSPCCVLIILLSIIRYHKVGCCENLSEINTLSLRLFRDSNHNLTTSSEIIVPFEVSQLIDFSSIYGGIDHVVHLLHPQFEKLCGGELKGSLAGWSSRECGLDLSIQLHQWLTLQCGYEGFPTHFAHVSPPSTHLKHCRVGVIMAYAQVDGYRNSDMYLNTARIVLPQLLSSPGHCVVLFSDDISFLENIRESVGDMGDTALITRYMSTGKLILRIIFELCLELT
jgi:hypothetical protein